MRIATTNTKKGDAILKQQGNNYLTLEPFLASMNMSVKSAVQLVLIRNLG